MKKSFITHLLFVLLSQAVPVCTKNIRVLVLVIASDQFPIYQEEQKKWRSYMHDNPRHVTAYFLKGNPRLRKRVAFDGDIIWTKVDEGWCPASAGIINKTILSLEALSPIIDQFDYVLRTNLSSFYIFPRLLDFLATLPKTKCYCGSNIGPGSPIASGCGFIMSPDVVKLLVKNKHHFLNRKDQADDVLIGYFMQNHGIPRIDHDRIDIISIEHWNNVKDIVPTNAFHFRLKQPDHVRFTDELYLQSQLIEKFYSASKI